MLPENILQNKKARELHLLTIWCMGIAGIYEQRMVYRNDVMKPQDLAKKVTSKYSSYNSNSRGIPLRRLSGIL